MKNEIFKTIVIEQTDIKDFLIKHGIAVSSAEFFASEIIHKILLSRMTKDEYKKAYLGLK